MNRPQLFKVLLILALLAGNILTSMAIGEVTPVPSDETERAPDFTLSEFFDPASPIRRADFRPADHAGIPLLLHFWQIDNENARTDASTLSTLASRYGSDELMIIGINPVDTREDVLRFMREERIYYMNGPAETNLLEAYAIDELPTSILINPQGRIAERIEGPLVYEPILEAMIALGLRDVRDEVLVEAPIPQDSLARYADLARNRSPEGYPMLGNPDAIVVVESFSSFSCPVCQRFHSENISSLMELLRTEDVAYIYVPIYATGSIPNGFSANKAALCAADQGRFWEYADALYDWHTRYGAEAFRLDRLRQGAVNLNLDMQSWQNCMSDEQNADILETALEVFNDRAYTGTPTVNVNGSVVRASFEAIRDAVNQIIRDRI